MANISCKYSTILREYREIKSDTKMWVYPSVRLRPIVPIKATNPPYKYQKYSRKFLFDMGNNLVQNLTKIFGAL